MYCTYQVKMQLYPMYVQEPVMTSSFEPEPKNLKKKNFLSQWSSQIPFVWYKNIKRKCYKL
jgi:hypothetical protein